MRYRVSILITSALVLFGSSILAAQTVVAFENVNVVPMDRERVVERQTVVVRGERIAEVGPAGKVKVPAGAVRIDGRGKYLMPGLAEMHGHVPGPTAPPSLVESVLFLYVANGVTLVRGMLGHPGALELRKRTAEGSLLGPTLYVAGPAFSGQAAPSVEIAQKMVREQKAAGYDLLKIQEGLKREVYDAIVATANEVKMPFGGHVPNEVGVLRAIEARQTSIDHLDNYLDGLEADDSPVRNADAQTRARQLVFHLDERKIPELARKTREAGVWNVPTMALWETFFNSESGEAMRRKVTESKYMPREMVAGWVKSKDGMVQKTLANILGFERGGEVGQRVIETRKKMLKALHDAGCKIALGTDSPQIFSAPGFSIHREMPIWVASGFTPFEVLQAGTRNVAEYFGMLKEFGTVEAGKRADLILLEADPLKDVAHGAQRAGVMVKGRWLAEKEIQERLGKIAAEAAQ